MNEIYFVLDDLQRPSKEIKEIIGNQSFGKIILRRSTIEERYKDIIKHHVWIKMIGSYTDLKQLENLIEQLKNFSSDCKFIHVYSDHVIRDTESLILLFQKVQYVREPVAVINKNAVGAFIFQNRAAYMEFLALRLKGFQRDILLDSLHCNLLEIDCFWNIAQKVNFLSYISSGFDARFFNSLIGDAYTLIKRSTKKDKIKSEYTFYHLLPEQMKMWFVRPFAYMEQTDSAQYSMERYNMADLAIRWIHGSVSIEEFTTLLKQLFYFIQNRVQKSVSISSYKEMQRKLYINKVHYRIEELRKLPFFSVLQKFLTQVEFKNSNVYAAQEPMEKILEKYERLYEIVLQKDKDAPISVIGHGDLCFSNILYSNEIGLLRFIDPKGAMCEEDLWTDPYYDLAKLSHSICGRYDFFNAGLYEIALDKNLQFTLTVNFDHWKYVQIFKGFLEANGYSYLRVRLFEVSLFLSMLPLHLDAPKKVFAFLLNALAIMGEIEGCLKK